MYRSRFFHLLTLLALLLSWTLTASAQSGTGQLSGTVTDANGARIPGATVTITNVDTALERRVVTDDDGNFALQLLPPGKYKTEVTAPGFKPVVIQELNVNVAQTATVDVTLEAGTVQEAVTVTAEQPLVQQESSQVGRVIEETQIRQLPLPTRNFQQLLTLSPGTSASVSNNTELGRGDTTITVNGQRTTSNNVRINGIDANSVGTNSTPNIAVPATDSLQEFIVQTSLYDASQGRNAGGNVEAITKSLARTSFTATSTSSSATRLSTPTTFFWKRLDSPSPCFRATSLAERLAGLSCGSEPSSSPLIRARASATARR